MSFQVGDVVMLKSGGPYMVVTNNRQSDGTVYCQWFVDNADVKGYPFPPQTLKKVEGPA